MGGAEEKQYGGFQLPCLVKEPNGLSAGQRRLKTVTSNSARRQRSRLVECDGENLIGKAEHFIGAIEIQEGLWDLFSLLVHRIYAAAFRSVISLRTNEDDSRGLCSRSWPNRKLISPPSNIANPER
jgi:hypothetical protein